MGRRHERLADAATPKLSVVIACHNAETVLGFQLRALSQQRSPVPWELLVSDRGSLDGSLEIARSWAHVLPIRIIDSSGVDDAGSARNAGVHAARGEWLGFCDADMEVGEGWLSTLCAALAEHPLVTGRFITHGQRSPRLRGGLTPDQAARVRTPQLVGQMPATGGGNLGIHRSTFLAVGGFDPSLHFLQVTDLCWRVRRDGPAPVVVPELKMHAWSYATPLELLRRGHHHGVWYAELERRHDVRTRSRPMHGAQIPPGPVVDWLGVPTRNALRISDPLRLGNVVHITHGIAGLAWSLGWSIGVRSRSVGRAPHQLVADEPRGPVRTALSPTLRPHRPRSSVANLMPRCRASDSDATSTTARIVTLASGSAQTPASTDDRGRQRSR